MGLEISILNTINQEPRKKMTSPTCFISCADPISNLYLCGCHEARNWSREGGECARIHVTWSGRGLGQKGMNWETRKWCREAEEGETTEEKHALKSFKETNCFHTRFEVGDSTKFLKITKFLYALGSTYINQLHVCIQTIQI